MALTHKASTPTFDLVLSEVKVRSIARSGFVAVLALGMVNLPVFAAGGEPLGIVIQAQDALLSNANAAIGATVYPGDALATERDGTLRLRVGPGQLYLAPSSSASLTQNEKVTRVTVASGTVGFVSVTSADIELQTPVALVRPANGQRAQGQVTVIGPNHMIVSAYSGALLVERNGESRIVEAGKSYNVSFDPNATPSAQQPAGAGTQDQNGNGNNGNGNNGNGNNGNGNDNGNGGGNHHDKGQLIFDTVVLGSTAVGGIIVWHIITESTTSPD
jgi:hypothetical protein